MTLLVKQRAESDSSHGGGCDETAATKASEVALTLTDSGGGGCGWWTIGDGCGSGSGWRERHGPVLTVDLAGDLTGEKLS